MPIGAFIYARATRVYIETPDMEKLREYRKMLDVQIDTDMADFIAWMDAAQPENESETRH